MHHHLRLLLAAVGGAALPAQTTWIVNAAGGPGVHFTALAPAVAAAAPGDTILVHAGPFLEGGEPFVTNKGLTIVGVGGQVPIWTTATQPIEVNGLPAGQTFRMAGFHRVSNGEIGVRLTNCVGAVHLENLRAREPDWVFPNTAAVAIDNCASVTMRAVDTFGYPAVQITNSGVVMTSCRLGITHIGLGGGPCLQATNSAVDLVMPRFDAAWHPYAITATGSQLRIAGTGAALVVGGSPISVVANGGAVAIDPRVVMGSTPVAGSAVVTFGPLAASFPTANATPGATWAVTTTAAPGWTIFQAFGAPGLLQTSPLGSLGIDPLQPYAFFPAAVVPAAGVVTNTLSIPLGMARGSAWATQAVVWDGVTLSLGAPATFVVQ